MPRDTFTLSLHMVASLDGFIAKLDNSVSWFETQSVYEKGEDEPDFAAFLDEIDCYIMGANTYELALKLSKEYGWPFGNKPTFVITHRELPKYHQNVQFYWGNLEIFIQEKLKPIYHNVWLVGGSQLAKEFLRLKKIDEIRMSILPIILGNGLPFFNQIETEQKLQLLDLKAYKNGMVDMHYAILKQ